MRNPAADRLRDKLPVIMQQWDDRVRAEVPAARDQGTTVLYNSLEQILEVLAKVLADQTDPRTAARDLAFLTKHGGERAAIHEYSLEQMILECQILQAVVFDVVEPEVPLEHRERSIVLEYLGEVVRVAAGEYVRVQDQVRDDYARKLEQADRAKDEFLAMLGHELRNPLSAMGNALYLSRMHQEKVPELQRPLDTLSRQTDHLTRLVNDLLDVARITQGKIILQKKLMSLEDAVAAMAQSLRPQIHAKGLSFRLEMDGSSTVLVDPMRLEQVLSNLVTNAVKYTETGSITVTVLEREDEAVIRIKDTGVGIAPDVIPTIFDLFTQVDTTLDRSRGGLGIGLTLVRRLVELHGGRVEAESEGLGKGCTFTVILPLAEASEPAEPAAAPAPGMTKTGLLVLVVDDNVDAADTLGDILQAWGHRVIVAHGGEAAMDAAKEDRPDLILLDIGLPDIDGYEVARQVRDDATLSGIRLVALTGYGQDEDQQRSRDAGFDRHLTKPVDLQAMQDLLTTL